MDPSSVLSKTQKGVAEIETRQHKLDHRLRALLIMVNGRASVAELAAKFAQLGDIGPLLGQLAAQGFVTAGGAGASAPAAPARPAPAAAGMDLKRIQIELAGKLRALLGPDADAVTEQIEACKSVQALRDYLEAKRGTLDAWLGKARAAQFWSHADSLLP